MTGVVQETSGERESDAESLRIAIRVALGTRQAVRIGRPRVCRPPGAIRCFCVAAFGARGYGEFMGDSPFPSRSDIDRRAHQLFVSRGQPTGSYTQFWCEAEQDLLDRSARRTLKAIPRTDPTWIRSRRRRSRGQR
jgi:hypothetical protein